MKISNPPAGEQYPIFNIKYPIFFALFFILFSLLFAAPVVAIQEEPGVPGAFPKTSPPPSVSTCTVEMLKRDLLKDPDFQPSKILPLCVYFEGTTAEKGCGCRNVNVLVSLLTKFATWLFGIVGAAALVVFIYGGFVILTAAGSAERVKKGRDALVAAVIGLVIVFTAQMGMKFLLKKVLPPEAESGGVKLEQGLMINMPEEK